MWFLYSVDSEDLEKRGLPLPIDTEKLFAKMIALIRVVQYFFSMPPINSHISNFKILISDMIIEVRGAN